MAEQRQNRPLTHRGRGPGLNSHPDGLEVGEVRKGHCGLLDVFRGEDLVVDPVWSPTQLNSNLQLVLFENRGGEDHPKPALVSQTDDGLVQD